MPRNTARHVVYAALTAGALLASPPAGAQRGGPPHAPLYGVWTGGFFPVSGAPDQQICRNNPSVVFAQDSVSRATLTETEMTTRVIETARATGQGWEFRFAAGQPGANGAAPVGFGCDDPDMLHVQLRGGNAIAFPGCADFPFPLVRCPGR